MCENQDLYRGKLMMTVQKLTGEFDDTHWLPFSRQDRSSSSGAGVRRAGAGVQGELGVQDRPRVPRQISQGNRIIGWKPKQRYLQVTSHPLLSNRCEEDSTGKKAAWPAGPGSPLSGDSTWGWKGGCQWAGGGGCEDQ